MNPSSNLFLIGPTGAGKTSIGRQLAARYGLSFIDLDQEIERHTGVPVGTIFDIEGEEGFRRREAAMLGDFSLGQGILLATGAGAVLNMANRRHLSKRGYVIWLQVTVTEQLERLAHDSTRPLLMDTDRQQRLQSMATLRAPFYAEIADLIIPPGETHETVPLASERCIALIDQYWNRQVA